MNLNQYISITYNLYSCINIHSLNGKLKVVFQIPRTKQNEILRLNISGHKNSQILILLYYLHLCAIQIVFINCFICDQNSNVLFHTRMTTKNIQIKVQLLCNVIIGRKNLLQVQTMPTFVVRMRDIVRSKCSYNQADDKIMR